MTDLSQYSLDELQTMYKEMADNAKLQQPSLSDLFSKYTSQAKSDPAEFARNVAGGTSRSIAGGLAGLGDLFLAPVNAGSYASSWAVNKLNNSLDERAGLKPTNDIPVKSLSGVLNLPSTRDTTLGLIDSNTNSQFAPTNQLSRIADTAVEWAAQAPALGAKKAVDIFSAIPAGAAYQKLSEDNPDSIALPLLGAIGAGGAANIGGKFIAKGVGAAKEAGFDGLKQLAKDESGKVEAFGEKALTPAQTLVYRSLTKEQGLSPEQAANYIRQAGKKTDTGIALTLPEVSENKTLLGFEKRLRQNPSDAGNIEQAFLQQRPENIQQAFKQNLQQKLPNYLLEQSQPAFGKIRSQSGAGNAASVAASDIVKKAEAARQAKAAPFYDLAYGQTLSQDAQKSILENPIISQSVNAIKKDPIWQAELGKLPEGSIGQFDVVKRHIDDQIESAMRGGENSRARILLKAKEQLLSSLDGESPAYQSARQVFRSQSPKVNRLQESVVGSLADLNNGNYETAGRKIFAETPEGIKYARRTLAPLHPNAWGDVVATHLNTIAEKANFRPDKLLTAFTSEGGGNIANVKKLEAAFTPAQNNAFKRVMSDIRKASLVRTGGSDTASNLVTDAQMADALGGGLQNAGKLASVALKAKSSPIGATADLAHMAGNKVYDWFQQSVRGRNYTELAKIFTGEGSQDFADIIMQLKPASPTSYKVIAKRIAEVSAQDSARVAPKISSGIDEQINQKQTPINGNIHPSLQEMSLEELQNLYKSMQNKENLKSVGSVLPPQSALTPETIRKFAQAESGGNLNARNPNSTATGKYQFTDGTWDDMVRKYGKETGIESWMKNDPQAQEIMAEKYAQENKIALADVLGREPTQGELYLGHFAGTDGAKQLLRNQGKNIAAARILPKAARTNRSIFYDGNRPRLVDEVIALVTNKIS